MIPWYDVILEAGIYYTTLKCRYHLTTAQTSTAYEFDSILGSGPGVESPDDFDWLFHYLDVGVAGQARIPPDLWQDAARTMLQLHVFGWTPYDFGGVARAVDLLGARDDAVAAVVLPVETLVEGDAQSPSATCI